MVKTFSIALLLVASSQSVLADDAEEMLMEDCSSCHQSEIYTRKNRKVDSTKALSRQVSMCVSATGASWFPDDQTSVVNYLNKTYYKFK